MIRKLQDIAPAFARAWLRLYTSGMPADLRDARHADVNTDLWEHQQDAQGDGPSPVAIAAEVLLRTLVGVPDDLGWRREAANARRGVANQGRIGTTMVSMGQIRWMGFCAVLRTLIRIKLPTHDGSLVYCPHAAEHRAGCLSRREIYGVTGSKRMEPR